MRDTRANSRGCIAETKPTRRRPAIPLVVAVAIGLSVAVGGATAASQSADYDPLEVAVDCADGTSEVTITNPNDVSVETTVIWEGDQSSTRIVVEGESTRRIGSGDGLSRLSLGTELTQGSLTAAVPAGESVAITGLADGTYALSAVADGDDVPLEDADGDSELTVECDTESAGEPSPSGDERAGTDSVSDRESDEPRAGLDDRSGAPIDSRPRPTARKK